MPASIETDRRKPAYNHEELSGSARAAMIFGAIAALILDYAAVAVVIGLFALDRWLGIRLSFTLDFPLVAVVIIVVALSLLAWRAGARLDHRLDHDISARNRG
jgi:hypothetical protein